MKLCRFDVDAVGLVIGDRLYDVSAPAREAIAPDPDHAMGDPLVRALPRIASMVGASLAGYRACPVQGVRLRSPVRFPTKIIAAPVNYRAHIAEMQASDAQFGHTLTDIEKAGLFLKATSSLVGPGEGIAVRFPERRTDYELELVAIIGRQGSDIPVAAALDYVAAYSLGLDITLRGPEDRSFRKSIDSYTVLGPWLVTADEVAQPQDLGLTLRVNGELRQDARTSDMVFDIARLVHFASRFYTLYPGDLLYTGTPQGVGPIRPGDLLRAECAPIGAMDVSVRAHRPNGG